jgi:hypothetical protein
MSRGRARFTEAEWARMFKAAHKTGVNVLAKLAPDGTLMVRTLIGGGKPSEATGVDTDANPWDIAAEDLRKGMTRQ